MFTRKPKPILLSLFVAVSLVLQACGVTTTAAPTETMAPTAAPTATTLPSPTPTRKPTATQAPSPAGAGRIPGGPILGSQAESEKAYDAKIPLLSAAATKSEDSTAGQETTTKFSVQVERPDEKLIWATGWCSSDPDTLTDNLKSIKFEGTVNDHPVDLKIASTIIGWAGDKRCKNISILVSGWPKGTTILEFKLYVLKNINNGFGEVTRGAYINRYEVQYGSVEVENATGTATEIVATDFSHIEGMPALMSQADTAKELALPDFAFLEDVADRSKFPVERHQVMRYFDGENIFVLRPPSRQKHLVWTTGWCAADQATLDQNLEDITFEMSINDTPIDIGQFYQSEIQPSGSSDYCRMYSLVAYDWPSGNTSLISKTVINKSINNGHKAYPASEITRTYTVITP